MPERACWSSTPTSRKPLRSRWSRPAHSWKRFRRRSKISLTRSPAHPVLWPSRSAGHGRRPMPADWDLAVYYRGELRTAARSQRAAAGKYEVKGLMDYPKGCRCTASSLSECSGEPGRDEADQRRHVPGKRFTIARTPFRIASSDMGRLETPRSVLVPRHRSCCVLASNTSTTKV